MGSLLEKGSCSRGQSTGKTQRMGMDGRLIVCSFLHVYLVIGNSTATALTTRIPSIRTMTARTHAHTSPVFSPSSSPPPPRMPGCYIPSGTPPPSGKSPGPTLHSARSSLPVHTTLACTCGKRLLRPVGTLEVTVELLVTRGRAREEEWASGKRSKRSLRIVRAVSLVSFRFVVA